MPPFLNTLQQFTPGRGYALNASAAGVLTVGNVAPSSFDLIDKAVADHLIDEETALVYTTYAAFGDTRLPAQYQGADSEVEDTGALRQAVAQWDSLSPQAQAILTPFLTAPSAPGSWLELPTIGQGGWTAAPRQAAAGPPPPRRSGRSRCRG